MTEPGAELPQRSTEPEELGGERACQLDRVCEHCGALPDGPARAVCERCGAPREP